MPLIGGERTESINGYVLVHPVSIGVRESEWLATDRAGAPCVLEIWERFDDSTQAGLDLDGFVDRFALQRRAASADDRVGGKGTGGGLGGGHVVAVHAIEAMSYGAYAVRDPYALSAAELVVGKARLRADALHEIVSGVVGGLLAFRARVGRPHGGLTASAVLISEGAPGRRRIGLRHPATGDELSEIVDPDGDELRRLGLLIFELVVHRPFRAMGGYPVRDGTEWHALGKAGPFWLGLVNDLLNPSGCRLSIGDVASRIAGERFKIDGPGPVDWLVRAGVAAVLLGLVAGGAWYGFRPRVEPDRAAFRIEEFDRWLRMTPVVAALRDESASDGVPAVLREAVGRLPGGGDGEVDPFRVYEVIESKLGNNLRVAPSTRLGSLPDEARRVVADDLAARAQTQSDDSDTKKKLEELAAIYRDGLLHVGIGLRPPDLVEGEGVGPAVPVGDAPAPARDVPTLLGAFSVDDWEARRVVEGLVGDQGPGWLHGSASELIRSRIEGFSVSLDAIEAGVVGGLAFEGATVASPRTEAASATVAAFRDQIELIEETAGFVGGWVDEVYPRIRVGAERLVSAAEWADFPGGVNSDLPVSRDEYLASFDVLAGGVGVVEGGESIADLNGRLVAAADAVDRVRAVIERGWDARSVDFLAHARWLASARERLEARPSLADASELASWIDARIAFSDEWIASVERSAAVPVGEAWPVADLESSLRDARELWDEAIEQEPVDTRTVASEIAGAAVDIGAELDGLEVRLGEVRSLPRWESLRARVDDDSHSLERDAARWIGIVEQVHAEVLQSPRDLIAYWQLNPLRVEGVQGSEGLERVAEAIQERYSRAWLDFADESGLGDEALKRLPESDTVRHALRGVDEVVTASAELIRVQLAEGRSYGGYDPDEMERVLGHWLSDRFAETIEGFEGWEEKARAKQDGAFIVDLNRLQSELADSLDALSGDLDQLAVTAELIGRGYATGDGDGSASVADRGALSSLVARVRGGEGPGVVEIESLNEAVSAVDGLVAVFGVESPDRLVGLFEAESGAVGRAGIAVEALRRLDRLRADGGWAPSVEDMLEDRAGLEAGLVALRGNLPESDFEVKAERLREIIRDWWRSGVGSASDRAAFVRGTTGVASWFDGVGEGWRGLLGEHLLEGRARYNMRVDGLRRGIAETAADAISRSRVAEKSEIPSIDAALIEDARAALDEIEAAAREDLGEAERGAALGWVREFRQELRRAAGGQRGWNEREVGPASVDPERWTADLKRDAVPPVVTYTFRANPQAEPVVVEFVLIENLREQEKVFLATDETSIALFEAMLRTAADSVAETLDSTMYEVIEKVGRKVIYEGNVVPGPSSRDLFKRGGREPFRVRPREHWLDSEDGEYGPPVAKNSAPAYPAELLAKGSGAGPKDIDATQGEPAESHPVNWVNPGAALDLALAVGCRLPTVDEFRAALREPGVPDVRSGRWNLRDRTFGLQHAHQERVTREFEITHYLPGKFSYDGTDGSDPGDWGIGGSDRWLWFCQTGPGVEDGFQDGIRFRHLIGNVGEYVVVDEGVRDSRGIRAMGASALSDPGVMPGDPREVGNERNGFVDVGFRLAIDADDFGSLGMLVQRQLAASEVESFVPGDR